MKKLFPLLFSIVACSFSFAHDGFAELPNSTRLNVLLKNMYEAQAPFIDSGILFFSYKSSGERAESVGVIFRSEGYGMIHPMRKNTHDVFFYPVTLTGDKSIEYKFVVDGLWITDPQNPNEILDANKIKLSKIDLEADSSFINSIKSQNGLTSVHFKTAENSHVYIVGDFNYWNPFVNRLTETSPGNFYIELDLKPGSYYYYFNVNGNKTMDPLNIVIAKNQFGETASTMEVPN